MKTKKKKQTKKKIVNERIEEIKTKDSELKKLEKLFDKIKKEIDLLMERNY